MCSDCTTSDVVLSVAKGELDLPATLRAGQCFSWDALPSGAFRGVLQCRSSSGAAAVVTLSVSNDDDESGQQQLRCHVESGCAVNEEDLRWYLRLGESLRALDAAWRASDAPMAAEYRRRVPADSCPGVRLLRQDPVECLISFVCSQNNRVSRIASLVRALRTRFGRLLTTVDGVAYHAFPTLSALAAADVDELRALSLGYRAPYIRGCAEKALANGGVAWLEKLADPSTSAAAAREALVTLPGVGPKVADCVCIYALEKLDAVPVDVHVLSIAQAAGCSCGASKAKKKGKKSSALDCASDAFREAFGATAGWAQCVLFTDDLGTLPPPPPQKKKRVHHE